MRILLPYYPFQAQSFTRINCRLLVIGLVLVLSGCASATHPAPDPIDTIGPAPSLTSTATIQSSLTVTPELSPTPTETPWPPPPTPTPAPPYTQVCIPIQDVPTDGMRESGVIVLGGSQSRLYNLRTLGKPAIPVALGGSYIDFLNNSAISPDRKSMIYLEGRPDPKGYIPMLLSLRILRSNGTRMAVSLPWDMRWNSISSWLDPETLLMAWDVTYKGRMTVIDPFTGSGRDLVPTFTDAYQSHLPGTNWDNSTNAVYSPDLGRVVYLRDDMVDPDHQMVLWDVDEKVALWQRDDRGAYDHTPEWAPGGSGFAVAIDTSFEGDIKDEIFLVSRDGEERQLTHLAEQGSKVVIRDLTWSPDGRSLAFWLDYRAVSDSYETEQLAVVDTTNGNVTLFCFGSGNSRPGWALDSQALAIELNPVERPNMTVVVDLAQISAYKIADYAYPVAWLAPP